MWKCVLAGVACVATAWAQPSSLELANLREDVRGLNQRVGELSLKIEQLERENAELRRRAGATDSSYATVTRLNEAVSDLNEKLRHAIASAKTETLQQVATQMEKLAAQTNAALESVAKLPASQSPASRGSEKGSFAENYPKEGVSYTVQKGDTLAIIAKKTGAKQQDIVNANKLTDPSRITVGQQLFIPGAK